MPISLLLLLCLLSATNLCSCLSSRFKANRKQDALALSILTPSGKYIASTEDFISGSSLSKRNGIVPLLKAAESVERNEDGSKVAASSSMEEGRGFEGRRLMDTPQKTQGKEEMAENVEEADRVGPMLTVGSKVATILNDVVENLASLRDLVNNLKYQNHVMYRQMKKMQTKYCSSSQNRMLEEHPPHHQALQQDGRFNARDEHYSNVPGPVSAALRVEKDAGPEAGTGRGTAAAGDGGVCPSQFSYSRETERCYRLSGDRMTWKMARERCRWMKGSLASVDSAKEQRVINDMARSNPATQHCDFWIGLTRQGPMSSDDWYWDGDGHLPSYSNWNDHEPNNGNGDEHCTQMLWVFNWKWNDAPCSHGNACFVCETRPKVTVVQ